MRTILTRLPLNSAAAFEVLSPGQTGTFETSHGAPRHIKRSGRTRFTQLTAGLSDISMFWESHFQGLDQIAPTDVGMTASAIPQHSHFDNAQAQGSPSLTEPHMPDVTTQGDRNWNIVQFRHDA